MNRHVLILAHPSMSKLAEAIEHNCNAGAKSSEPTASDQMKAPESSASSTTVVVHRRVHYSQTGISWGKFADGFPNLFINDVKDIANRDVIYVASFHNPEVIFEQLSIIYAIPRYLSRSFTLILPYFPTGTMERVDTEGQIATAKTLAQLLSNIPLTSRGPSQIVIFDIHALQERFYFGDNVTPRLETAVHLLKQQLKSLHGSVSIAFPDDGAHKRFHNSFSDWQFIICDKFRDGAKRIVKVKEGQAKDQHVVIVDDLVQTGGTLIECAKALLAAGARHVSAYVTHAVFPNDSWQKFMSRDGSGFSFCHFWITDSLPHAADIAKHPPFHLLSLAPAIADMLYSYDLSHD